MEPHENTFSVDDFPESIRHLAAVLNREAVLRFLNVYGGTRLLVPVKFDPDGKFAADLGPETALAIYEAYRGENIEVPRAVNLLRSVRNREICELRDRRGLDYNELARRFHLTRRQVSNILRRKRRGIDRRP